MNVLIWLVIICLFILSFVALVFPVLPSVTAVWAGFLIYQFLLYPNELTLIFWISMVLFTLILTLSDLFASSLSVKRFGGSKLGEKVAAISVIAGSFIFPPFGVLIVPFITVFIAEIIQKHTWKEAWRSSVGSLVGFLTGKFAQAFIQLVMIIVFLLTIWF